MTEASYQLNTLRGVTGYGTGTCFAATLDRVSLRAEVKPRTYQQYADLRAYFVEHIGDGAKQVTDDFAAMHRTVHAQLWRDLRVAPRKIAYRRANSPEELEKHLGDLLQGGFRVSVVIKQGAHAIGLMRTRRAGLYVARSTSLPWDDDDMSETGVWDSATVIADDVWRRLCCARYRRRPNRPRSSYAAANIVALPPER